LKKIKAGIIGAAGFTGQELIKILSNHDFCELVYVTSTQYAGKLVNESISHLSKNCYDGLKFSAHPETLNEVPSLDIVFLAVPDEVAMHWSPLLLQKGVRIIDISGSFRIKEKAQFELYYKIKHSAEDLLPKAVYGMSEIHRKQIKEAALVANPGCYATSVLLPLFVLKSVLKNSQNRVIVDAKSGTSGAGGRKEKDTLAYSSVYENFKPYKVNMHQHIPEIEQEIVNFLQKQINIRMTPYLLPVFRGILTTMYIFPEVEWESNIISDILQKVSAEEPFIRYIKNPDDIDLKNVQNTNFIDISFHYDKKNNILVLISAIDNLVKGAAGQAVQNMNIMFSLDETHSLF